MKDGSAGNVVGKQVRRALNALERAADAPRQSPSQHGFGNAGNVFQKNVAVGQVSRQRKNDFPVFAEDDGFDVFQNLPGKGKNKGISSGFSRFRRRRFGFGNAYCRKRAVAQNRGAAAMRAGGLRPAQLVGKLDVLAATGAGSLRHNKASMVLFGFIRVELTLP